MKSEKIPDRGARITCPKCEHKFVVHRPDKAVVGAAPPSEAAGLPVAVKKKDGEIEKKEAPPPVEDEDDESDAPTTVMPFGSSLAHEIRASMEAQYAEEAAPAPQPVMPRTVNQAKSPPQQPTSNAPLRDTLRATPRASPAPPPKAEGSPVNSKVIGIGMCCLAAMGIVGWLLLT